MKEGDAWLRQWVSPSFLFAAGLALAPALWLQTRVPLKAGQAVFFFVLAAVFGRLRAAEALRSAAASVRVTGNESWEVPASPSASWASPMAMVGR